ncbi:MAG: hypothetical protein ACPG77_07065 [Nannocystaceae bacterium]
MNDSDAKPGAQRFQILVCDGPSCGLTFESDVLREQLEGALAKDSEVAARVTLVSYTCFGRCGEGPNMYVRELAPGDDPQAEPGIDTLAAQRGFYPGVSEETCRRLVNEHCKHGKPIEKLVDDY